MRVFLLTLLAYCLLPTANCQLPMSNWSNTGPLAFPINVSGQVHGIGRVSQIKFHVSNPAKIYAVSASGGLFITSDTGHTWAPTPGSEVLPQTSCSSICIDYTNDQILYLCLGDANYYSNGYGIYKSTNGGATWAASNTGIGTTMAVEILMQPTNNQVLVAATRNGIWKTTNAGVTWTQKQATQNFRDMKMKPGTGSTTLYATAATSSGASTAWYSTDFGDTWIQSTGVSAPSGNDGMRLAVSPASPTTVYLAATDGNGVVWKSTNSGVSYTQIYSSSTQCLTCYDANPSSGSQGDYNFDLNVNPTNASELLMIAHCVWRSTDGGVTWSKRTAWYDECHTDMHHIEWNPYNNSQRWNANDGGVWMSTDPVATVWGTRSDGLACTEIYRAAQSPVVRELVSIGTQDNGELYYTNGIWKTNRGGDWSARNWFDYGTSGTVYYLGSGDRRNLLPLGGDQSYNIPFTATNNARIDFVKGLPGTAFIVKDSIWRSSNINTGTPAWTMIKASTNAVRAMMVSTADSNILFVVSNGNVLYRSKNALSATPTFTTITTPGSTGTTASITTVKSNKAIVFMSCGAAVYRSADTGNTWTNITGTGLSGLNIRRIIHDDYSTNERLFVNAGAYVHYKNNTATVWTNHSANAGLPTVANATDFMIFNNGTVASLLRLSTYGRGVWQCDINANLPPLPDFTADKQIICPGDTVHFTSTVFGNNITGLSWTFAGGTPATSTAANPTVVYNTAGTYAVTLTATNSNGSNTETKTAFIVVSTGQSTAVQEGFEGVTYPPAGWQLLSTSGNNWTKTTAAGGFGASAHSIIFDNYNIDAQGKHDRILAPKVNLAGVTAAQLKFDVAYSDYGSGYPDSLQVRISTDCGHTWAVIYNKTGAALATAPSNTSNTFVPTATQWRTETVSLTPYINNGILISFDNIGHYGQALYIDNVNITPAPLASFAASDTAICAGSTVLFSDSSLNATAWSWSFPGGTPASATTQNVSVTYPAAGTYSVTLTATNSAGNGVRTKTGYIHVTPLPAAPAVSTPVNYCLGSTASPLAATGMALLWYTSATGGTGSATPPIPSTAAAGSTTYYVSQMVNSCEGPRAALMVNVTALPAPSISASGNTLTAIGAAGTYQWYLNGVAIAGATGASYNAGANGSYTVMVTDGNGCSGTSAAYNFIKTGVGTVTAGGAAFDVYPNPSRGTVSIHAESIAGREVRVTCYNSAGQLVRKETLKVNNGTAKATFDWSGLAKGVYDVRLETEGSGAAHIPVVLQ